uniref:Inositol polyphosphate-5-phosphatase Ka n=1 Tax=Hippocampus comes TaxID=109280 RepID=A0A3Q3DHH4_HIPCM
LERFGLHIVTWNVATADPLDDMSSLLRLDSPEDADLYVIGLQEVYSGPLRFMSDVVLDDPWSSVLMTALAPRQYVKVSSIRMQGLLLLLFSKLEHLPFIRDIQTTYTRTGIFGYWGNKGGVSIRLSLYGHMLCFLNCHLVAHMKHANERVVEFEHILNSQNFNCEKAGKILDHRLVFWFGDLNFRIQDHGLHFVRTCISNQNYSLLWNKDQLIMMKEKEKLLQEFEEGPLDFQPTYKFDVNTDTYDSRVSPAYCSKTAAKGSTTPQEAEEYPLEIRQDLYTSNMDYSTSDHKPVTGIFTLKLKKMYATPLVHLQAEGEWSADIDAMLLYSPLQPFPSSTWDWIGLYKVGFTSVSDYITYTWVKDDEVFIDEDAIKVVNTKEIPVRGGECLLGYYCHTLQCIIGISEPFRVHESKVAIEEGLLHEKINILDQIVAAENIHD